MSTLPSLLRGKTRFGRLIVIEEAEPAIYFVRCKDRPGLKTITQRRVHCRCDCGCESVVFVHCLAYGVTKSCGCLRSDAGKQNTTHGGRYTPEYAAWHSMKARVLNPNDKDYAGNGAVGVLVCDRWLESFEAFLSDMGPRPSAEHRLNRYPNSNGNFEPSNCRWATPKEQARNRRNSIKVTVDGEQIPLREACEQFGIHPHVVSKRKRAGWPESRWFEPVNTNYQRFKSEASERRQAG